MPSPFSSWSRLILSHAPQAQAVTPKFVQQELSYCHLSAGIVTALLTLTRSCDETWLCFTSVHVTECDGFVLLGRLVQHLCTSQDSVAPFRWASRQTQADSKTGWQGYGPRCMATFLWVVPPFFNLDSTAPVSSFQDLRWPFRSLRGGTSCPHSRFAVASQACLCLLVVHLLAAHRVCVRPRTGLLAPALSWQRLR